ncbi:MAG: hypothetical protein ACRCXC_04830 [Legionella sp.]
MKHTLTTDTFQKLIYQHKNADRTVREALSAYLSHDYLLPVLKDQSLDKEELLEILKNPAVIDEEVFQTIAENPAT